MVISGLRGPLTAAVVAGAVFAGVAHAGSPPPLTISPPGDITVAATTACGQTDCASVSYSFTVSGGVPPYNLVCNLPSGGLFTVGSHTVSCLAQDSVGDSTPQASFTITVTAGGPPPPPPPPPPATLTISPPGNITVAATTACGQTDCASVTYSFTVSGGVPPYNLVCNLPSGGLFTVGSHTVSCLAQDSVGDSTPQASFTITVTPMSTTSGGGSSATGGATGSGSGGTSGGGSSGNGSGGSGGETSSGKASGTTTASGTNSSQSRGGTQPTAFVITAPSTIWIRRTSLRVEVTVTTHNTTPQTLCWRSTTTSGETCALGHGTWHIRADWLPGKHVLLLRAHGEVVARKTILVKVQA